MSEEAGSTYKDEMDNYFRYGGETEGKGPEALKEPSQRAEELRRVGGRVVLSAGAIIEATLAVGTAKDPDYIGSTLADVVNMVPDVSGPLGGNAHDVLANIFESVGNVASSHPNPTVAILGLSAVTGVFGRGLVLRPSLGKIFGRKAKP